MSRKAKVDDNMSVASSINSGRSLGRTGAAAAEKGAQDMAEAMAWLKQASENVGAGMDAPSVNTHDSASTSGDLISLPDVSNFKTVGGLDLMQALEERPAADSSGSAFFGLLRPT